MILVEVNSSNYYRLITKLISFNISISNIDNEKDKVRFVISYEDYLLIKKYLKTYDIKIIRRYGANHFKDILKKHKIYIISLIIGLVLFMFLTNIIVDVKVISSDKSLIKLLETELDYYHVKRLTFKKSFNELESIKNKIIENNKNRIEWLSIKIEGMNYVVNVEERIINEVVDKKDKCHIIASKNGIIRSISNINGVNEVAINDYVEKDSILISGIIKKDEEIKDNICANGSVYAEVWYRATLKVPLTYEEVKTTDKVRYNLMLNDYLIFKSRLNKSIKENKKILSIFANKLYLVKEYEVTSTIKKYNNKEVENRMDELLTDKFNIKLKDNEYIINKSILSSNISDNYLNAEVFVAVNENIAKSITYTVEEDSNLD